MLTSANLIDGAANTRGRFFLIRSPLALNAGTHRLTVIFRPAQPAYYTTAATTVLVRVNPRPLALGLTGLTTTPHGQSVTVTVLHLIPGAKVTVGLQPSGGPATYAHLTRDGCPCRRRAQVAHHWHLHRHGERHPDQLCLYRCDWLGDGNIGTEVSRRRQDCQLGPSVIARDERADPPIDPGLSTRRGWDRRRRRR